VFTIQNSTPLISASTIRFTAFEPPPPTPTTLMVAALLDARVTHLARVALVVFTAFLPALTRVPATLAHL
jgi:hypothetical protein